MAIAFFYAVGTAIGGIIGPLLFGKLIESGEETNVMCGYLLGAALMIAAGIVEVFLGVEAAQKQLEDIATPLTAEEADEERGARQAVAGRPVLATRRSSPPPRACPTRTSTRRSRRSRARCARRASSAATSSADA